MLISSIFLSDGDLVDFSSMEKEGGDEAYLAVITKFAVGQWL